MHVILICHCSFSPPVFPNHFRLEILLFSCRKGPRKTITNFWKCIFRAGAKSTRVSLSNAMPADAWSLKWETFTSQSCVKQRRVFQVYSIPMNGKHMFIILVAKASGRSNNFSICPYADTGIRTPKPTIIFVTRDLLPSLLVWRASIGEC